jgi:hypothetical protein
LLATATSVVAVQGGSLGITLVDGIRQGLPCRADPARVVLFGGFSMRTGAVFDAPSEYAEKRRATRLFRG